MTDKRALAEFLAMASDGDKPPESDMDQWLKIVGIGGAIAAIFIILAALFPSSSSKYDKSLIELRADRLEYEAKQARDREIIERATERELLRRDIERNPDKYR